MASAQRWVDNQCCRCVLPCSDYKTPISGECSVLPVWYVGICDVKCWILLTCFVYMAIYDLEIQLFHSFSVLKNCFLTFSYFQLRSVGYMWRNTPKSGGMRWEGSARNPTSRLTLPFLEQCYHFEILTSINTLTCFISSSLVKLVKFFFYLYILYDLLEHIDLGQLKN